MDEATLANSIAELTGTLRPTAGTTEADLERGRLLVAQALRSGQTSAAIRGTVAIAANPEASEQAKQFRRLSGPKPATTVHAFLRTVPSPTSLHPSVPASVRGIAVTDSAGPFLTPLGNPIWIDAFNVIQLTPVTRHTTDRWDYFLLTRQGLRPERLCLKLAVSGFRLACWPRTVRSIPLRDSVLREGH